MNIDYCIHRFGEWTMLMLGETVLSLLIVDGTGVPGYYGTFMCGLVAIILLQYLHFRSQPHDPDEHAMRRHRISGILFSIVYHIYSLSLVILGATYKMFLYEYVYAGAASEIANTVTHGRSMLSMFMASSRWLSGSESAALRFTTSERQRRIAIFFSGSFALVWLCMDALILAHKGMPSMKHKYECNCKTGKRKLYCAIMFVCRVALIAVIATLFLYETRPNVLALIGLCGNIAQLLLRVGGSILFPPEDGSEPDVPFLVQSEH
jgi:hypothetical protein